MNDAEIVKFIENILSYALIRDEYRDLVDAKKRKEQSYLLKLPKLKISLIPWELKISEDKKGVKPLFCMRFTSAKKSSVWQQTFHKKYVSLFVNSPYLVYNKVESMCADTVSNSISTFVRKNVK